MSFPLLRALQRDRFFQLLIIVGVVLSLFVPFTPRSWPGAIDWHTIITLSGLMLRGAKRLLRCVRAQDDPALQH